MASKVSELIEGRPYPVTIKPSTTADVALDLMGQYEFSQLPIVDENKRCSGLVTAESMLRAIRLFNTSLKQLKAADCSLKPLECKEDDDLFEAIEGLAKHTALIVLNKDKQLKGILTDYDLSVFFRQQAQNMMILRDIEFLLRDFIRLAFPQLDESVDTKSNFDLAVKSACVAEHDKDRLFSAIAKYLQVAMKNNKEVLPPNDEAVNAAYIVLSDKSKVKKSFGDLSLAEYGSMWLAKERWDTYSKVIELDKTSLQNMIDQVKGIRNDIAHFRSDPTKHQKDRAILLHCRDWMQKHYTMLFTSLDQTEAEIQAEISKQNEDKDQVTDNNGAVQNSTVTLGNSNEGRGKDIKQYVGNSALRRWLGGVPTHIDTTWLTFERAQELLVDSLPSAAFEHRSWWSNESSSGVLNSIWLDAGWETDIVDLENARVRFRRLSPRLSISNIRAF